MKRRRNVLEKEKNRGFTIGKQLFWFSFLMLMGACSSSDEENVLKVPTVISQEVLDITHITAISGGVVNSNGGSPVFEVGVCWAVNDTPTIMDAKTTEGAGMEVFSSTLVDLVPKTTYYVRAYATNTIGTSYGETMRFTTNNFPGESPTIATSLITNITNDAAVSGGIVTSDGANAITARGVCWSTLEMPTISDFITLEEGSIGSFVSTFTGLQSETKYYLRAYATNIKGTSYGSVLSFTTTKILAIPTVATLEISELVNGTAKSGGIINSDGGSTIIAKGVCWSLISNPSITDSKTDEGTGAVNFSSDVNTLKGHTTYYLRAYATNAIGTAYGEEISFTTGDKEYTGNVYLNTQQKVNDFGNLGYTSINGDLIIEPLLPTHFSNLNGLQSIISIEGVLIVSKTTGLTNLSGLKNVVAVGKYVSISLNQELTNIGLVGLATVKESLSIHYNENLLDLDGLDNLQTTNSKPDITIWNNVNLKNYCAIQSLLTDYTGEFSVYNNGYNPSLQNIVDGNCSM